MKSRIGEITHLLFLDKYSRNPAHRLNAKERIKLQKEKAILINCTDECEAELNADNSNVSRPPSYEYSLT